MNIYLEWTAWISLGGLLYIYAGYPLLVLLLARLFPRVRKKGPFSGTVSAVIACYRDAEELPGKVRSLLDAELGDRIREVLIGFDGPEGSSEQIAQLIGDERVIVKVFPSRRGKTAVLNDLVTQCSGDILLFTDARQHLDPSCLRRILENFADPGVGVVSGELEFREGSGSATSRGMGGYWRYEKMIRKAESAFSSVPGATGACYAVRRELVQPVPSQLVLDDVALPLLALRSAPFGTRCILEEGALVYDRPSTDPGQEAVRKRRTIGGNLQLVLVMPWLLVPWFNPAWFQFLSHKLARLVSPLLLVTLFIASFLLLGEPIFLMIFTVQTVFYVVGITGLVHGEGGVFQGILSLPSMFLRLNAYTVLSVWDVLAGRLNVVWKRAYK